MKNTIYGLSLLLSTAFATDLPWYDQRLEGWYYFEDPALPQKKREEKAKTPEEAAIQLQVEKQQVEALRALALLNPEPEHVRNYMEAQQRWMKQSAFFARTWDRVLLNHPELSDSLVNPTSTFGIQARQAKEAKEKEETLQRLAKDHFFLFLFQGKDLYSQKAASIVKSFTERYQWQVKAVSLDGEGVEEFPEFVTSEHFGDVVQAQGTPAFFVVNPKENTVTPVGVGLLALSQLEANIALQMKEEAHE